MVLSIVAEVYDVTGFAGPLLLQAKAEMQKIWKSGISWDDELPEEMKLFWYNFLDDLKRIDQVSFPMHHTYKLYWRSNVSNIL